GALLGALVGYRTRPSLLEVLAFSTYLPAMGWALHRADVAARGAAERGPARSAAWVARSPMPPCGRRDERRTTFIFVTGASLLSAAVQAAGPRVFERRAYPA